MAYKCREGYPLPGYNGHTTDEEHCPHCGSIELSILSGSLVCTSGRRIGICRDCGENYIVEPRPRGQGDARRMA